MTSSKLKLQGISPLPCDTDKITNNYSMSRRKIICHMVIYNLSTFTDCAADLRPKNKPLRGRELEGCPGSLKVARIAGKGRKGIVAKKGFCVY
jgi:hypothetical protein